MFFIVVVAVACLLLLLIFARTHTHTHTHTHTPLLVCCSPVLPPGQFPGALSRHPGAVLHDRAVQQVAAHRDRWDQGQNPHHQRATGVCVSV